MQRKSYNPCGEKSKEMLAKNKPVVNKKRLNQKMHEVTNVVPTHKYGTRSKDINTFHEKGKT